MILRPGPKHTAFRDDVVAVLRKHAAHLSAPEMLALSAHLTGQIIALQDQRSMSPDRAMEIVAQNIEQGNKEVITGILDSKGSA
jgi:hypothetical protein